MFEKGNKLAKGGWRPGAGRNVELNKQELALIRKDWPLTVVTAFRIYRLWLTQDHSKIQYLPAPLEKKIDDAWKVINKWLPDAPKEIADSPQGTLEAMLEVLREYKSLTNTSNSPTPSVGEKSVLALPLTNGNGTDSQHSPNAGMQDSKTALAQPSVITEESHSSSPSQEAGTLDDLRKLDR